MDTGRASLKTGRSGLVFGREPGEYRARAFLAGSLARFCGRVPKNWFNGATRQDSCLVVE
jgi:hypothetical protein